MMFEKSIMSHSGWRCLVVITLILGSQLVGCANADKKQATDVEPENVATLVQNTPDVSSERDEQQSVASADALMATLVAPIVEPVSASSKSKETSTKVSSSSTQKAVKPVIASSANAKVSKSQKPQPKLNKKVVKSAPVVAKPELVKTPAAAKRNLSKKPLSVVLADLPVTYDIWQLKQGNSALEEGLVISTPTWEMGKEGYMSQIWLTLMEEKILVNSSSDIDESAGTLGIKINDGELIPFTRIIDNNIGVLEGQWLEKLKAGGEMDIYLGFFPDKRPISEVFKSDVILDNLSRVVPTYRNLLK